MGKLQRQADIAEPVRGAGHQCRAPPLPLTPEAPATPLPPHQGSCMQELWGRLGSKTLKNPRNTKSFLKGIQ